MRTFYPNIDPYETGFLCVSNQHKIYYEESGHPAGQPILFVHGGPGSNTSPVHRQFFDPAHYRIILFDQRGCGKSTPPGSLIDNTTQHLVADMEKLRKHLGVKRWLLFGGSWGSALSLAYAQQHPERVTGLILRGIFTVSHREVSWFYQDGASRIFPDEFEKFIEVAPTSERGDLLEAYHRLLNGTDRDVQVRAARAWCRWEAVTSFLEPREEYTKKFDDELLSLAFAKIECHYFKHNGFFATPTTLIDGVDKLRSIPARIIQGRYDLVCPMETAWILHQAWPEADFRIVPTSGHSAMEEGTVSELVKATDDFRI
jgi:proline iminopeptidase